MTSLHLTHEDLTLSIHHDQLRNDSVNAPIHGFPSHWMDTRLGWERILPCPCAWPLEFRAAVEHMIGLFLMLDMGHSMP